MTLSRRDFVNGVAVSLAAVACGDALHAPAWDAGYPPAAQGLQGQTDAAATIGHGRFDPTSQGSTEPAVDAVIIGAGVSGLAAAHFYRERFGPEAKLLLLDPAEDFGGHARRNEFRVDGRTLIGYGGSEAFQSPRSHYGATTRRLLDRLGIDLALFETGAFDRQLYPSLGLRRASFFRGGIRAAPTLVTGDPTAWVSDDIPPEGKNGFPLEAFIEGFPIPAAARQDLLRLWQAPAPAAVRSRDAREAEAYLATRSYARFLAEDWGVHPEAIAYLRQRPLDFFALPIEHIAALDAAAYAYPGFRGIPLPPSTIATADLEEPYIYHFPDGNATVARALVGRLRPDVVAAERIATLVTARVAYERLADPTASTRILLRHGARQVVPQGDGVEVTFQEVGGQGRVGRVRARHAILACFSAMASRLTPSLPATQHEALQANERLPLVYVNVAVRDWTPWRRLGIHDVYGVDTFYCRYKLDYPVSIGAHRFARDPAQPTVLHLVHVPYAREVPAVREAVRTARRSLYTRPFADFERAAREELAALLGPGGFDFDRDVVGLTVNRWAHGYSWGGNTLVESPAQAAALRAAGRAPAGPIVVAGSDAGWSPYLDGAIDEAYRAVSELPGR